ncbi:hypothetical protein A2763_01580 [Candidatus Kaiserbacteria bacterium RIFCSPHIGHO2_01_FULL_54_36]|uniref:Uncharacterized protein n=1 Tax=Candidatus Kaiserbacteria bacterium RIFCSPHIGHO2_01_FULL_54_36 TaxID=1798482 RepID=A0A1F6CKT4_9BACT|nr:MAG: hypothetical protein A2763_01580 [Candidatus Kaiserbacteria bacterium RIFCSPHIGHO2_01_FULL_54_36]OGG75468.1 MAG: hypothetical protein A3A41_01180 [Candidatus Kaiserbacteria bacterium RIFCSPLOWO2_01_FULL_54_22]
MGGNADDYTKQVQDFLHERGRAFTLAFSGGADDKSLALDAFRDSLLGDARISEEVKSDLPKLAEKAAQENIAKLVRSILEPLRGYRIAIQTGGTKWGVPDAATRVAKELGFPTIGVYPLTAKNKSALPPEMLDLSVCVHPFIGESSWGDESAIFTKLLDSVVVIGGGAGTMVEVAHLLKINERKSEKTKWIIPVYGTGGTADKLSFFPGKPDTIAKCIPSVPIRTGKEVVDFLIEKVMITDDIYEPA